MTERLHFHFSLSCIGEGNGNPLQCSCLENPRDGGAWWAAVYGVVQSRTQLKRLSSSSSRQFIYCSLNQLDWLWWAHSRDVVSWWVGWYSADLRRFHSHVRPLLYSGAGQQVYGSHFSSSVLLCRTVKLARVEAVQPLMHRLRNRAYFTCFPKTQRALCCSSWISFRVHARLATTSLGNWIGIVSHSFVYILFFCKL